MDNIFVSLIVQNDDIGSRISSFWDTSLHMIKFTSLDANCKYVSRDILSDGQQDDNEIDLTPPNDLDSQPQVSWLFNVALYATCGPKWGK